MVCSARGWTGLAWRALAALCALLATGLTACSWFTIGGGGPDYGVEIVSLDIKSFSYAPSSPAHVGDTLTFYAELEPAANRTANVSAFISGAQFQVALHDDGQAPDTAAGDNTFSGSGAWLAVNGTGDTQIRLYASGQKPGAFAQGQRVLPLTVQP
jgi:hypothetical protein